jgi:hypothetical protein
MADVKEGRASYALPLLAEEGIALSVNNDSRLINVRHF